MFMGTPRILFYQRLNCRDRRPRLSVMTQKLLYDKIGQSRTPVPTNEEHNQFVGCGFYIYPFCRSLIFLIIFVIVFYNIYNNIS